MPEEAERQRRQHRKNWRMAGSWVLAGMTCLAMRPTPRSCYNLCGALSGQCARSSGHQPEPRKAPEHYRFKDGEARPQAPSRRKLHAPTRPICLYYPRRASLRKTVLLASLPNRHQGGGEPARRSHRRCWSRCTQQESRVVVYQQPQSDGLEGSSKLHAPRFRPRRGLGAPSSQEGGAAEKDWWHPRPPQQK